MSIDITKVSSMFNQLSTPNATKTNNNSVNFAEYLMNTLSSQNNSITNNVSSVFPGTINDMDSLKSTIGQALKSNQTTDLPTLFNSYNGNERNTNSLSNLLGTNSSSSSIWNDLFMSQSSQTSALQTLYSSSSTTDDTISNALQTNFLSTQMKVMQTAYDKLQQNLEEYKERNIGIETDAIKIRIGEMSKNVSAVQTFMQEKLPRENGNG